MYAFTSDKSGAALVVGELPRRAITYISIACSKVNIGGLEQAAVLTVVGRYHFG
jgi:hypothetical protein